LASILVQQGTTDFPRLHLVIDVSNGILSLLLAVFLMAEQYDLKNNIRNYLVIGFGVAAFTEILHALVGIEWFGHLAWIQDYSNQLRPATWPPSTYALPIALFWLLRLEITSTDLSIKAFKGGMLAITILLYALSLNLPKYVDTGILGIQRPTQVLVLIILLVVISSTLSYFIPGPL
jgi:vacuolar-type H+-ATPase subunit I/STV1